MESPHRARCSRSWSMLITIARFRSIHFAPCAQRVMAEVSTFLYKLGEISGEAVFIDGTKIEACANKYTFVWKKSVTKNMDKLLSKLAAFVEECEELYGIKVVYQGKVHLRHVKKLRKKLYALKESEGIEFVHGSGKKKSLLQKSIETLEGYLAKLKEYPYLRASFLHYYETYRKCSRSRIPFRRKM